MSEQNQTATSQSKSTPFVRNRDPDYVPGRNAELIRSQATRVIRGRIPAQVRKELMTAYKAGYLGRLAKDGLKPEIFFDPSHYHGAVERQTKEALYAVSCIAKVMASPADVRAGIEAAGGDALAYTLAEAHSQGGRMTSATRQEIKSSQPKLYASLVGPLLGMYYPLPADLNKAQCRAALNTSRLKSLWHSVYTREDVLEQIGKFGGQMLPDGLASHLDYDSHVVSEWAGVGT